MIKVIDCFVKELTKHKDLRGSFVELLRKNDALDNPVQINCSFSKKDVLRGLHITPFSKLVTCLQGRVYDVCVDFRKDSSTYLQYQSVILSPGDNQIHIPANCGHGFMGLEEENIVVYAQEGYYDPATEKLVHFQSINIEWPKGNYILSEKDNKAERWLK